MPPPGEITLLLQQADSGDREAANRLFQLVQEDLKAIAKKRKKNSPAAGEMSTTGLVDDAFCKLVGQEVTTWKAGDRRKFFVYAATKIHNMLIEQARAQAAQKRGGDRKRIDAQEPGVQAHADGKNLELLVDLQSALDHLETFALDECIVFRIRHFLGCTFEETADILGVSDREIRRRFQKAQLLLQNQLKDYHDES